MKTFLFLSGIICAALYVEYLNMQQAAATPASTTPTGAPPPTTVNPRGPRADNAPTLSEFNDQGIKFWPSPTATLETQGRQVFEGTAQLSTPAIDFPEPRIHQYSRP
jgi:hypothetical protein